MRIQRNLLLIDIYTICRNMHFWAPVLLLYYRDQIGIGFKELMIGEAVFSATIMLLDVPTGWLSDIWKRKHTQAVGLLFAILGYSCLMLAESFSMVLLAQVLIGTFVSLCSGTDTAILYDSLLSVGREKEYLKREGRRVALLLYSVAGVCVAGGFLYPMNHKLPLALTIVAMVIALIVACMQDEPERQKKATESSCDRYYRHNKIRASRTRGSRISNLVFRSTVLQHENPFVVTTALLFSNKNAGILLRHLYRHWVYAGRNIKPLFPSAE